MPSTHGLPVQDRLCLRKEPALRLGPGNVRASTRATGPWKPPQNCSLPSAPPAARLTAAPGDPLTREHCDSHVTKGAFHGCCSGRVGTSGLLWRPHWAQQPQPSPETNPFMGLPWGAVLTAANRDDTESSHIPLLEKLFPPGRKATCGWADLWCQRVWKDMKDRRTDRRPDSPVGTWGAQKLGERVAGKDS